MSVNTALKTATIDRLLEAKGELMFLNKLAINAGASSSGMFSRMIDRINAELELRHQAARTRRELGPCDPDNSRDPRDAWEELGDV